MLPLILSGVGALAGGVKHFAVDKPQAEKKRFAASEQTRWSPWTGMGLGDPGEDPSALGSILGYGSMGAGLGQSIESAGAYNDFLKNNSGPGIPKTEGISQIGKFSDPSKSYFGSGVAALPMSTEMYPENPSVYQYKGAPWSPRYR